MYFLQRGRKETEGEKHQCARETSISCLSHCPYWGNLAHTPGMCPDLEFNQ